MCVVALEIAFVVLLVEMIGVGCLVLEVNRLGLLCVPGGVLESGWLGYV